MLKYKYLKRALDIFIAYFSLIFSYIPMLIIALLIYFIDGGPIIFKQVRVGKDGKLFVCYKFKTMRNDAPKNLSTEQFKNSSDYITHLGGILRRMSLDELPQLFNVLCGDMSIVGPRPALWNQHDLIELRDSYRKSAGNQDLISTSDSIIDSIFISSNDLRPGLTGWAQVNGRDELPIEVKAAFDGEYLEKISFWFDCKCFVKTITSVLKSDGVVEGKAE